VATILLVDDDDAFRRNVSRGLRRIAEVVEADSFRGGERALEAMERPMALLIDYMLPGGTGLELLAIARDRHIVAPAAIITGDDRPETARAASALGASYLPKPFRLSDLQGFLRYNADFLLKLEAALSRWCHLHQLTDTETDVLRRYALDPETSSVAEGRRNSEETIRKHVTSLLDKTEAPNMRVCVARLLRETSGG
jgi:DNA-binding NarL/FixJ family response regulator